MNRFFATVLLAALIFVGCPKPAPVPSPDVVPSAGSAFAPTARPAPTAAPSIIVPTAAVTSSTLAVANDTDKAVKVYVAFGANSVVLPAAWSFCTATAALNCSFELAKRTTQPMPLGSQYLNATLSFDKPVGCETTKAEIGLNNPSWYDQLDVSLVDGFNKLVAIDVVGLSAPGQGIPADAGTATLGPPRGPNGNEAVFGVFPSYCDLCTSRGSPPCGAKPGKEGCKHGTQYKPDVVCQWQGAAMGGGSTVTVRLLAGVPAQ